MPLTDLEIRKVQADSKARRMFDGGGLYLEVAPSGGKWWRFKYRFAGKEKRLSLGIYPDVSLKAAREKRDDLRRQIAMGIDPANLRKSTRGIDAVAGSFEAVARLWHGNSAGEWAASHSTRLLSRLETHVFPFLGNRPIRSITSPDLMNVIERVKTSGRQETARRILTICGQVFRYAVQKGFTDTDPAAPLKGCVGTPVAKNMATITDPELVGKLLQAIEDYPGTQTVRCALQLAPLLFVRSGELRNAEWSEIDFERREWKIPVERMKLTTKDKRARQGQVGHIVPLATQALDSLQDQFYLTGQGRLVFPGLRSRDRAISDATLTNALRRLGYTGDEMTIHGFRHMASTLLHELGFSSMAIERQLAHKDRNRIRGIYNQAEFMEERRRMMQSWADYLDQLKAGKAAKVVPIGREGRKGRRKTEK